MKKSAEAFRTISEVAEIVEVPQHVLRFWETRFAQVRPVKRGGGRRLYRPGDIDLLLGIKRLLYAEGYTIKGVQKLLKEHGATFVGAVGQGDFAAAEEILRNKLREEQAQNELFPEGILPEPKKRPTKAGSRKFFGFLKQEEETKDVRAGNISSLSKNKTSALQEVLLELVECKRILDRAR